MALPLGSARPDLALKLDVVAVALVSSTPFETFHSCYLSLLFVVLDSLICPCKVIIMKKLLGVTKRFRSTLSLAWQDLRHDIKAASWMNIIWWPLIFLSILLLLLFLVLLPFLPFWGFGLHDSPNWPCQPDNTFSLETSYNVWKPNSPFEVNIAFGNLSFAHAKLIDVFWDVVSATSRLSVVPQKLNQ